MKYGIIYAMKKILILASLALASAAFAETVVNIVVECEGYITHAETLTLTEDVTLNIELEEDATDTEQKISE